MRPLGRGRTNYLSRGRRGEEDDFNLTNASQGQESASEEPDQADPWDDEKAVRRLKEEHELSDEHIDDYRQRHEGLTPAILASALSENLGDTDIAEAIQKAKTKRADDQFDATEASRVEASKLLAEQHSADARQQRPQNLRPFPLNPTFQSQPVLSEELREMIYLKVVRDQLSVRTVSTLMSVSMERVGAVVRMKQMERDWIQKVSSPYSLFSAAPLHTMMIPIQ
jgi:hypothetical protein